ncbi:cytochrome b/b6 domain-containing protein [Pelagibius sp. Alg239-R121]|uniref:cytochrome b/b6 domain-containing protein n=1 Tax=Pelagibius sp. Alg239-R121 TaxID=2993448 RepID=UPI0024A6405D|nr:cytochrome b/b6 domain-containing protein [Pelagibius sp. Alg239-R121]
MLLNTRETYGLVAQLLHWVTAGLILTLLPLGLYMEGLPQGSAEAVLQKSWWYSLHKTLGVLLFLVALVRVAWALVQPHPRPLNAERTLESLAAQSVHWMLYGAILCMPLTGWLHHSASEGFAPIWWPFFQDLPLVPKNPQLAGIFGTAHVFTGILLGLALALHVAGALKHAVIDRDSTLRRMIPGRYHAAAANPTASPVEPRFARLPAVLAALSFLVVGVATLTDFSIKRTNGGADIVITNGAEASSAGWTLDKQKSRLDIQIIQMGNPVAGSFEKWDAVVNFDPDNIETASLEVQVDVGSISLGGVSEQAKGVNFLNAAMHPIANFVSESFVHSGEHSYAADGQLSLAGHRQPLALPFMLRIENGRAYVEAELTIERLAFGIGEKGFTDDGQLGFGVLVKVILEAERAAPGAE